jgi:hypothetical protein
MSSRADDAAAALIAESWVTHATRFATLGAGGWRPRSGRVLTGYHLASDGQGLLQLRQEAVLRKLAQPLDGRHPAAL